VELGGGGVNTITSKKLILFGLTEPIPKPTFSPRTVPVVVEIFDFINPRLPIKKTTSRLYIPYYIGLPVYKIIDFSATNPIFLKNQPQSLKKAVFDAF
jgi:hypothetical protein